MIELDAKSAADRIRADVLSQPDITAEARHALAFTKAVCEQLGLDPDPPNMAAVASALQKADIKPHVAQEYPKMLTDDKGKPVRHGEHGPIVVFNSAEEEKAYQPLPKALEASDKTAMPGATGATGPAKPDSLDDDSFAEPAEETRKERYDRLAAEAAKRKSPSK